MNKLIFRGKPTPDEASRVCLLFNPADGRVVHVHGVSRLDSAVPLDNAEMEHRARKHAETMGRSIDGLHALHVALAELRRHRVLRVDQSGKRLAPQPEPSRTAKR